MKSIFKGRAMSRSKSRRNLGYEEVLERLKEQGISIRVASPKLVMEEAPEAYKNVTDVVDTCHAAGISKKAVKLRPIAVIKGWNLFLFFLLFFLSWPYSFHRCERIFNLKENLRVALMWKFLVSMTKFGVIFLWCNSLYGWIPWIINKEYCCVIV